MAATTATTAQVPFDPDPDLRSVDKQCCLNVFPTSRHVAQPLRKSRRACRADTSRNNVTESVHARRAKPAGASALIATLSGEDLIGQEACAE